jgi:hypothetical protein
MQVPSLLLAAGLALATAACGSDSPSEPNPRTPLECEARDYPCSLSEVSLAVLERGDALGDQAMAMLEAGASTEDAAGFLESQADMAEVEWDDAAIWYRLEDGLGHWILWEVVGAAPAGVRAATGENGRGARFHIAGPEVEQKTALVLSPFSWEYLAEDEGADVAAILSGTRGYANGVTHRFNDERTTSNVSLGSYLEWGSYQVIHVSTHGSRICDGGSCRAVFAAGLLETALPPGPETKAEKLKSLEQQGVTFAKGRHGDEYLVLTADFFRQRYPGGLKDALVFINTCKSFGPEATDLADAIRGNSSVFLGWTEGVLHEDAGAAAAALYQALSQGYPARVALGEIGGLAVGRPVNETTPAPELWVSARESGGDLRIREVVTLLQPVSGEELTPSDRVEIEGTADDGEDDAVPVLVRIDGVKPDLADGMTLHVEVDGAQGDPIPLTSVDPGEEDRWLVSGVVPLHYDVTEDRDVEFRARITLHDGGESRHATSSTIGGAEPIMGRVWDFEAVQSSFWVDGTPHTPYGATTRLTLRFAPGQAATEPQPDYVITGGTVTFDYNHTYFDCVTTAPVQTFDVTPDVARDSRLQFNTGTNPVEYFGLLSTYGPEFTVTTTCGGGDPGTRTHRAVNTWLLLAADAARAVAGDRRSFSGTYRVTGAGGDFVIETTYTATRRE